MIGQFKLKRELGVFTSTLLVMGIVVGSGIFQKIIPMAQTGLGVSEILAAWFFAGLISLIGAISIGGLASLTEESGGPYEYFRLSYGNFVAFMSGWADFMIIGTATNAAIAFLFAQTVNTVFPLGNPLESLAHVSIANYIFPFANSGVKILGISTIIVLTFINCFGVRESGWFNNMITIAKVLGILILIVVGLNYSKPEIISTISNSQQVGSGFDIPFMGLFLSALVSSLWAYDGWIFATNVTGEIINPKKTVPRALIYGIVITMLLYVLVNYVYMNVLSLDELRMARENEIGAILVAQVLFGEIGRILLFILILICVFGALNSNIISTPRKYYQMAVEGFFFKKAAIVNPRYRTPINAMLYSMVWSCLLLISGSFELLTDMVIFSSFVFYGLLCLALIKMKRNGKIQSKVFGYPIFPIVFTIFSVILTIYTIYSQPLKSMFGLLLILSSIPFYYYFKWVNKIVFNQEEQPVE